MKKLFTLAALAALCILGAKAADEVYYVDLDRASIDTVNSTQAVWKFTNTDITLEPAGGRDFQKRGERQGWDNGLNFKNNTNQVIKLGANKMYAIEFFGYSMGDNWDYIYAYGYGEAEGGYEWVDPIGTGEKDNQKIIDNAKYPLDPCVTTMDAPVFNQAGYKFATINFENEPYEGEFQFIFSGNNQEQCSIRIWITPYDPSHADGIQSYRFARKDGIMYNILGQKVDKDYRGLVIMDGRKYILNK